MYKYNVTRQVKRTFIDNIMFLKESKRRKIILREWAFNALMCSDGKVSAF